MLYPRLEWQHDVTSTIDISGNPSMIVGSDERLYFASAVKGDVGGIVSSETVFSILVGCLDNQGTTQWLFQDPRLVTSRDDTQPVLALGSAGELYIVFVTTGAVPGASNGADTFSFCGNCGSAAAGREDIVVARLNGIQTTTPSVVWVTQDAYLNSCNRETTPRVVYDRFQERLLIAYECTGATLCKAAIGGPNIVVACLTTTGGLSWAYQEELLNGRGQNRSPSIAVDASGGIYIAYSITRTVEGGGALQGQQDVEVVKLLAVIEGCGLVIKRPWILSGIVTVNAGDSAFNVTPSIGCDTTTGNVFVTFTTTGQVPGGTKTAADTDIVFVSLTLNGQLRWIQQGPLYNEVTYRYRSINRPNLLLNCGNSLYIAAHAYDMQGYDMIVVYRLDNDTGETQWLYKRDIGMTYRAYIPVANFETPFASEANFGALSAPWMTMCSGLLYLGVTDYDSTTTWLFALRQQEPYADLSVFEYLSQTSRICERPTDRMMVQLANMSFFASALTQTYYVDTNGVRIEFVVPPDTAPMQERIDALQYMVTVIHDTYIIIDNSNGSRVEIGTYITPEEQVNALERYLAIFSSTYTIFDANGDRVHFDLPPVA